MRTKILVAVMAFTTLAMPCAALAQISDQTLAEHVATVVHKYLKLTMFDDVTITVKDRNVTLTGSVTESMKRDEVGARAAKVDGIRTFDNQIRILPSSPIDAQLRRKLAMSIYGHPAFQRFAEMREPPIHILVEGARVTLIGYVNTEGDKALASALAQVPGVMSVKNELKIDTARE